MLHLFERIRGFFNWPAPSCRICQPRDWLDREGWDTYWRAVIADHDAQTGKASPISREPFLNYYLPLMRERGNCRILFAGNGISLEPRALAHCGFDVTAADVSPSACDFVREFQLTAAQVGHFLPAFPEGPDPSGIDFQKYYPPSSLDRARKEHRPGGRLEVLAEDLLHWSPVQPFDFIYAERAIQWFSGEVQQELARRFFAWLSPGGMLVASTVHAPEELEQRLNAEFKAAGFLLHLEESTAWRRAQPQPPTEEGRELLRQEDEECVEAEKAQERVRLAAGEKLMVLWNSRS
jgi:SAM-dependent methyltransferase